MNRGMPSSLGQLLFIGIGAVYCLSQAANASDVVSPVGGAACTLCLRGENITLPEKGISIPGFEFVSNCQALASLVPIFQQGTDQCDLLQSIGTLCGCPKQENACDLCQDGSQVQYGQRPLPFLADLYGGIIPTCELVEAGLHSYNESDPNCSGGRLMFPDYCGCGAEPGSQPPEIDYQSRCNLCFNFPGAGIPFPEKEIDIVGFPFRTCGALANATVTLFEDTPLKVETLAGNMCWMMRQLAVYCGCDSQYGDDACPICREEQSYEVPFPDRRLNPALTSFFLGEMEISCGVLADLAKQWSATLAELVPICNALQGLGTKCGCALPSKPTCPICEQPLPENMLARKVSDVSPYNLVSCGLSELASMYMSDGDLLPFGEGGANIEFQCRMFRYAGYFCGCNDGLLTYWGADTLTKQIAAVWMQRVTALFSLVGSFAIVVDIFRSNKVRSSLYHQIMLGLSCFDICSSIAWGLGPLPSVANLSSQNLDDADIELFTGGKKIGFYGAYGTDATCKAQGFLLHLGFTSVLFNVVLSYYYKRSVVDGMRDNNFSYWHRVFLLGAPILIGTGVALAAIHFIHISPIGCTIDAHSSSKGGWISVVLLFYLPYGPAFVYLPLNTFFIYWKFQVQMNKSKQYRLRNVADSQLVSEGDDGSSTDEGRTRMHRLARRIRKGLRSKQEKQSDVESEVFWQAFWYVCGFYASYVIFLISYAFDGYAEDAYWFYILLSTFTPMQGFFNSLVYFRRRKFDLVSMYMKAFHGGMEAVFSCCVWCKRRLARGGQEHLSSSRVNTIARGSRPMHAGPANGLAHFSSGGLPPSEMSDYDLELTQRNVKNVKGKASGPIQFSSGGLPPSEMSDMEDTSVKGDQDKTGVSNSMRASGWNVSSKRDILVGDTSTSSSCNPDVTESSSGEGANKDKSIASLPVAPSPPQTGRNKCTSWEEEEEKAEEISSA